ncbi:MAG TPA: M15 family peptidase [Epsilonproteobacteria bacterium]|nr:M15 family peptidase [Campylobacterota bacterium]
MSYLAFGKFEAKIKPINQYTKQRMMEGNTWRKGCPVDLKDLRYIRVKHRNFYRSEKMGEMIVHKDVAQEVVEIFRELYTIKYPIRQMRLISDFRGRDWDSIEADNTSAFNCRKATGSKNWSKHSYGKAIDINPIENPYISKKGRISHKASLKYKKRVHKNRTFSDQAVLLKNDKATQIFKKYGWKWGGEFKAVKDYQHFSK